MTREEILERIVVDLQVELYEVKDKLELSARTSLQYLRSLNTLKQKQ